MRDAGVRIARQRLLRFRPPDAPHKRLRRLLFLGIGVWALWAALLSDHSIAKLLQLRGDRDRLTSRIEVAKGELARAEERVIGEKPTPEQAERLLRERHNYAREGELVYVIGEDSVAAPSPSARRTPR